MLSAQISTCGPGLLWILSGQDELAVCTTVMSEASNSHHYAFSVGFLRVNLVCCGFCPVRMNWLFCTEVTSEARNSHICFQRRIPTCGPGLLWILSGQDEMIVCTTVTSEAGDSHHYAFSVGFLRVNLVCCRFICKHKCFLASMFYQNIGPSSVHVFHMY